MSLWDRLPDEKIRSIYQLNPEQLREKLKNMDGALPFYVINRLKPMRFKGGIVEECQSAGASGCVRYGEIGETQVAIKQPLGTGQRFELFYESLINSALFEYTNGMTRFGVPEVLRFGKFKDKITLVQKKVNGVKMHKLKDCKPAVKLLCEALTFMQHLNFLHRDLHPGNVLYDGMKHKVYILDFGHACLEGVQWKRSGFAKLAKQSCINESHDICYFLVTLHEWFDIPPFWLTNLCKSICTEYKNQRNTPETWSGFDSWNRNIFSSGYITHMADTTLEKFKPKKIVQWLINYEKGNRRKELTKKREERMEQVDQNMNETPKERKKRFRLWKKRAKAARINGTVGTRALLKL